MEAQDVAAFYSLGINVVIMYVLGVIILLIVKLCYFNRGFSSMLFALSDQFERY